MTVDMTNNRVPYGLLTDEEKAALHEHEKAGGVVEHHCDGVWFKDAPSWFYNVIYRTVPLPAKTQDVIAWEKLPDWAEWVARDENGRVFTLPTKPFISGTGWGVAIALTLYRRIDDFPGIVQIGTCDWQDSKQRRPQK
jgi:hypothetical protein